MEETILKLDWERHENLVKIDEATLTEALKAYTTAEIDIIEPLNNGCANSNYKITFSNSDKPVILRIFQRDYTTVEKEKAIHHLIKDVLPVATIYHTDASCEIIPDPYAIIEYMPGILLRELVFSKDESAITSCMYEAGEYLHCLKKMALPQGGFFKDDLQITPFTEVEDYESFLYHFMNDAVVQKSLGNNTMNDLQQLISQTSHLLPSINDANITHGDYDPANILVVEVNGKWQISAILDWEFCFAGSYIFDMGNMLRYSHKLPDYYETAFIAGITDAGTVLSKDWRKQVKLIDLINLLQLTHASPAEDKPFRNRDLVRLINHTIKDFHRF